ncbi:hypothetical protein [Streptomyces sp. NPDC059708]|uniref:hypothetical protein n=1 Tax=Streptomyces sp. NPDC059708 TaxID=3346916 RepID=UPI00368DF960
MVLEGDGGAGEGLLVGALDAVAVAVEPDAVADLHGGFVAEQFEVAEAVGLAEGAPPLVDLVVLRAGAGAVVELADAAREDRYVASSAGGGESPVRS